MKQGAAEKQGQGTMQGQTSRTDTGGQTATASTRTRGTNGQESTTGETDVGRSQGTSQTASLSTEQRTRITDVIKREGIRPEENVHFSVSVGTTVPRTIHLHRLPRQIIEVEPRWRHYEFVLVNGELVIVNPRTFEIVAIMPA
jgi:hypothetical protein